MNFNIISEKDNPLFSRKEIVAEIKKETTPKKAEVEALLGEKFSSAPEAINVSRILSRFGSDVFTIHARIYKSKEDKDEIEPKIKKAAVKAQ